VGLRLLSPAAHYFSTVSTAFFALVLDLARVVPVVLFFLGALRVRVGAVAVVDATSAV
jgi:hypothetical protein